MTKRIVAITGASGYIGRHLVAELIRLGNFDITILSRGNQPEKTGTCMHDGINVIEGDLGDPAALRMLVTPGSTVINLAYLWDAGEAANLENTQQLIEACANGRAVRLIHCSTAAVAGRVSQDRITEDTPCRPVTEYGITKLKIEQLMVEGGRRKFDSIILRPTSVFGIDGDPLKKLAGDLSQNRRWRNYAKSCLFGKRQMNLVHVANVVAALVFLANSTERFEGETFIVSDDDSPNNNFASVERCLMEVLRTNDYPFPRLAVPLWVLSGLLRMLGRNNVNPRAMYDCSKLLSRGFSRSLDFDQGLIEYANWYASACRKSNETSLR